MFMNFDKEENHFLYISNYLNQLNFHLHSDSYLVIVVVYFFVIVSNFFGPKIPRGIGWSDKFKF